jgi:hypothetical protein
MILLNRKLLVILLIVASISLLIAVPIDDSNSGRLASSNLIFDDIRSSQNLFFTEKSVSTLSSQIAKILPRHYREGLKDFSVSAEDLSDTQNVSSNLYKKLTQRNRKDTNFSYDNKFSLDKLNLEKQALSLINLANKKFRKFVSANFLLLESNQKIQFFAGSGGKDIVIVSTASISKSSLNNLKKNGKARNREISRIQRNLSRLIRGTTFTPIENLKSLGNAQKDSTESPNNLNDINTPTIPPEVDNSNSPNTNSEEIDDNQSQTEWYLEKTSENLLKNIFYNLSSSANSVDTKDYDKYITIIESSSILSEAKRKDIHPIVFDLLIKALRDKKYFSYDNCFNSEEYENSRERFWEQNNSIINEVISLFEISIADQYNQFNLDKLDSDSQWIKDNITNLLKESELQLGCKFLEDTFWDDIEENSEDLNQSYSSSENKAVLAKDSANTTSKKQRIYPFYAVAKVNKSTKLDSVYMEIADNVQKELNKNNRAPYLNRIAHYMNLISDPDFLTKGGLADEDIDYYLGGFWGLLLKRNWADPFSQSKGTVDLANLSVKAGTKLQEYASKSQISRINKIADKLGPLSKKAGVQALSKGASAAQKVAWIITVLQVSQPIFKGYFEADKAAFFESQSRLASMSNVSRLITLFMIGEGYFTTYHIPNAVPESLQGALDRAMNNGYCKNTLKLNPNHAITLPICWHPSDKKILKNIFFKDLKYLEDNSPIALKGPQYHTFEKSKVLPFIKKWSSLRSTLWSSKNDTRRDAVGKAMVDGFIKLGETYVEQLVEDVALISTVSTLAKPATKAFKNLLKIQSDDVKILEGGAKVFRTRNNTKSLGSPSISTKKSLNSGFTYGQKKSVIKSLVNPCKPKIASIIGFDSFFVSPSFAQKNNERPCSLFYPKQGSIIGIIGAKSLDSESWKVVKYQIEKNRSLYALSDDNFKEMIDRMESIIKKVDVNPSLIDNAVQKLIDGVKFPININQISKIKDNVNKGQTYYIDDKTGLRIKTFAPSTSNMVEQYDDGAGYFRLHYQGVLNRDTTIGYVTLEKLAKKTNSIDELFEYGKVGSQKAKLEVTPSNTSTPKIEVRFHTPTKKDHSPKPVLNIEAIDGNSRKYKFIPIIKDKTAQHLFMSIDEVPFNSYTDGRSLTNIGSKMLQYIGTCAANTNGVVKLRRKFDKELKKYADYEILNMIENAQKISKASHMSDTISSLL